MVVKLSKAVQPISFKITSAIALRLNRAKCWVWLGMFTPADTPVPAGFDYVDFPADADLGTCWIYGKESEVHTLCGRCRPAIEEAGMTLWRDADGAAWCFENCTCPRYTTPDDNGNIILDYCWFVQ